MAGFCSFCGAPVTPADRFCGGCGKPNHSGGQASADALAATPAMPRSHVSDPPSNDKPGSRFPPAVTSVGGPPPIPPPEPPDQALAGMRSPCGGPWLLIAQEDDDRARRIAIEAQVRVGRSPVCEVLLRDPQVSRVHATLDAAPEGIWLTDHNSTNGTRVNGRRITGSTILHDGDAVMIGSTRFKILAPMKEDPMDPGATIVATVPTFRDAPPPSAPPAPSPRNLTCRYCRSINPLINRVCSRCGKPL